MARSNRANRGGGLINPNFNPSDPVQWKIFLSELNEIISELAGVGRNTVGYGTAILGRDWPDAYRNEGGLLSALLWKVLVGIYEKQTDDSTTSGSIYIGFALSGTATSAASWMIFRVDDLTEPDNPFTIVYADADDLFDNVWDNRASLNYGPMVVDELRRVVRG